MSHNDTVSDVFVVKHPRGTIVINTSKAPVQVFLPPLGTSSGDSKLTLQKKGYHPMTIITSKGSKLNGKDIALLGYKGKTITVSLKHDGTHWTAL